MRVVLDTNVLVSAVIKPTGVAAQILLHLRTRHFEVLMSRVTFGELTSVLFRPRLRTKYGLSDDVLQPVLRLVYLRSTMVQPQQQIVVCRDPKDNMYLEVAVEGQADFVITGDSDLLILHPFRGIPIITPSAFLKHL